MCLAAFIPAGQSIPRDHIDNASRRNPDGAGIAYARRGKVCIVKGLMSASSIARVLHQTRRYPRALHFRFATHGAVSRRNCHPFRIAEDCAVIHNGMIAGYGSASRSDTAEFTRSELIPMYLDGSLRDRDELSLVAQWIGEENKLVLLHGDGSHHIVNEHVGHWLDGVWYSNDTYATSLTLGLAWDALDDGYGYATSSFAESWEDYVSMRDVEDADLLRDVSHSCTFNRPPRIDGREYLTTSLGKYYRAK